MWQNSPLIRSTAIGLPRKTVPRLGIFWPCRRENIDNHGAFQPADNAMFSVPRRNPEITFADSNMFAFMDTRRTAFDQNAPLFLRVTVDAALCIGADRNKPKPSLFCRENMSCSQRQSVDGKYLVEFIETEKNLMLT